MPLLLLLNKRAAKVSAERNELYMSNMVKQAKAYCYKSAAWKILW